MATAVNAYLEKFALSPVGVQNIGVVSVTIDATLKPTVASDVLQMFLVPAGTRFLGYIIRTNKAWTGTISLGLTGALTGLASTVTPSTTVGDCIANAVAAATMDLQCLTTGKYMELTTAGTNTTGSITIDFLVQVMTPFNVG
jgi:hypothetical protein